MALPAGSRADCRMTRMRAFPLAPNGDRMRVRKGLILAAGHGTRMLPITKAGPKEMLPLVDRPLIQYAVEECVASGIEQVIMITATGKRAIEDYFD